jgi:hypothetical protein
VRAIAQIVIAAALLATPGFNVLFGSAALAAAAAASAAVVTGLAGGKLGQVLKAAVIAGAIALAFNGVGDATAHGIDFSSPEFLPNVVGHAAVGCVSAVASGGQCGPGALSAGAGAAVAPLVSAEFPNAKTDFGQRLGGSAVEGIVGGLASVAGGGKFADGAVTAAFGYLFNDLGSLEQWGYAPSFYSDGTTCNLNGSGCFSEALRDAPSPFDFLAGGILGIARAFVGGAIDEAAALEGATLYRVFGGEARALGDWWTTVDPATVANYRNAAGLFPANAGTFVVEGTLTDTTGVTVTTATPGYGGVGGGLPSVIVPNAASQISIQRLIVPNPPY